MPGAYELWKYAHHEDFQDLAGEFFTQLPIYIKRLKKHLEESKPIPRDDGIAFHDAAQDFLNLLEGD